MATGYEQLDEKKTNPFPVPGGYILTTIVSSTTKKYLFSIFWRANLYMYENLEQ